MNEVAHKNLLWENILSYNTGPKEEEMLTQQIAILIWPYVVAYT